MKLLIEIPKNVYENCCKVPLNAIEHAVKNSKPLDDVLDEIKSEITANSYLSYDDNPRLIIDESWVLEIIDKYKEGEEG